MKFEFYVLTSLGRHEQLHKISSVTRHLTAAEDLCIEGSFLKRQVKASSLPLCLIYVTLTRLSEGLMRLSGSRLTGHTRAAAANIVFLLQLKQTITCQQPNPVNKVTPVNNLIFHIGWKRNYCGSDTSSDPEH